MDTSESLRRELLFARYGMVGNITKTVLNDKTGKMLCSIIEALEDKHVAVRRNAAVVLEELKNPESIPALTKAIEDEVWTVRHSALAALISFGDFSITSALIKALDNNDFEVRNLALETLGDIGDPRALSFMTKYLRDENLGFRCTAASKLEKIGIEKIPEIHDKVSLLLVLGKKDEIIGMGTAAVPALIDGLDDTYAETSKCAAEALEEVGFEKIDINSRLLAMLVLEKKDDIITMGDYAVPALRHCLGNDYEDVCLKAIEVLTAIGSHSALQVLIDSMKNSEQEIRESASENLGKMIKKADKKFLSVMVDMLGCFLCSDWMEQEACKNSLLFEDISVKSGELMNSIKQRMNEIHHDSSIKHNIVKIKNKDRKKIRRLKING